MRNVWLQNPLVHLEESSLEPTLNDLLKNMTKCVKKFIEVPGNKTLQKEKLFQMFRYLGQ